MDSVSSGSLQSSSGGDEEYDSRADRFSAPFLTNPPHIPKPNTSFNPFSNNFFDPLPNRSNTNSLPSLPTNPTQSHFMDVNQLQSSPSLPLSTDPNNTKPSGRNPRKRTRASRRAPTTVLTTDTSNFRAMVQEFTGIPAPPFAPVSPFPRPRLDLFSGSSTSTPPYLLRPFPQKLSPFLSPSPSDFLLPKQNSPLPVPNTPIPSVFNFQPNINLHSSDFSTTERNRNPLPLPEELLSGNVRDGGGSGGGNFAPASWGGGGGGGGLGGGEAASDQSLLRSMNAKYSTDSKLNDNNLLGSSSSSNLDFRGDKGSENVTNRSEGMIESWICSSD